MIHKRELERFFNGKINMYRQANRSVDGTVSDSAEKLIHDFLMYTLSYRIESEKDVPEKFMVIFE